MANAFFLISMALFVLFSAMVHEVAHGYTAYLLGDKTALRAGRLTLNPLAHIDPIGSVLLPIMLILGGSRIILAWAKPVPINPSFITEPVCGVEQVELGAGVLLTSHQLALA